MLKIMNVSVSNLYESIVASGFPMLTKPYTEKEFEREIVSMQADFFTGHENAHVKRACTLGHSESNSGHGNFLSGVNVQFNVVYPEYWSPEFQRYHFAQIVSSSSKMHRLNKMSIKDSVNKYVKSEVVELIEQYAKNFEENPTYENRMILLSNCPLGLEKLMRVSTNYLQLLNIWKQRHTHRLKEDWGEFCSFIENLPMFTDLTGIKVKGD